MKHPVNSSSAWYLKNMGYPQPEIQEGQFWQNGFGYVSEVVEIINTSKAGKWAILLQESETYHAMQIPTQSRIAYVPTLEEIPGYHEGMTETDVVQQWIRNHGKFLNV